MMATQFFVFGNVNSLISNSADYYEFDVFLSIDFCCSVICVSHDIGAKLNITV